MGEVFFSVINLTGSGVGAFFLYHLKYFLISCINLTGSSTVGWLQGLSFYLVKCIFNCAFCQSSAPPKIWMSNGQVRHSVRSTSSGETVFVCVRLCVCVCLCLCEGCAVSGVVFVCTSKKGMEKGTLGAGIHRLSLIMFWSKGSSQFLHKSIYYR